MYPKGSHENESTGAPEQTTLEQVLFMAVQNSRPLLISLFCENELKHVQEAAKVEQVLFDGLEMVLRQISSHFPAKEPQSLMAAENWAEARQKAANEAKVNFICFDIEEQNLIGSR